MQTGNQDAALPMAPNYKTDGRVLPYLVLNIVKCLKNDVCVIKNKSIY